MKRLFVFIPATLLVLYLLNSFVLKEKTAGEQTTKAATSGPVKTVFKSIDGGQTWQDISNGLPENLREDSIRANKFFANDKGLFLMVGNGLYQSTPNATAPYWAKAMSTAEHPDIIAGKSGIPAYNYWGINLKKTDGKEIWSPVFENFQEPRIRSVFETADGAVFIGIDRGFYKTVDNGNTWKHVHDGTLVGHLAEGDGILLAISARGIIRSTDNGENWAKVNSESSVAWDVKSINGGFAAMTSHSESGTRRIKTSYDGGKTWQQGDNGSQRKISDDSIMRTWNDRPNLRAVQTSITQVGKSFFCIHRDGIFKSTDEGKTWKLSLPAIEDKVFNIFFSGKVIYAIPSKGGC